MVAYIFVVAAILAVIPILIVFKINLDKVKQNPNIVNKAKTNLFIGVGASEAIPIILLIYGFMELEPVANTGDLLIPGLIIVLLMGFAVFFVSLQKRVDVESESRTAVNEFSMLGLPLAMAIPVVAIVSLFLMMPS